MGREIFPKIALSVGGRFGPRLTHGSLDPSESIQQTDGISVDRIAVVSNRQTHVATLYSVTIGRILCTVCMRRRLTAAAALYGMDWNQVTD